MEVNSSFTVCSADSALIFPHKNQYCRKGAFALIGALPFPKFNRGLNISVEVSRSRLKLVGIARSIENTDRGQSLRGSTRDKRVSANHALPLEPAAQSTARECLEETPRGYVEFSVYARKQLELLAKERQAHDEMQLQEAQYSSCERTLRRRIAEVKAKERANTVEEIMHALVVNSFTQAGIPMVSSNFLLTSDRRMDLHSIDDQNYLEALHSPLVQEMIKEHVAMIIAGINSPHRIYDLNTVNLICRTRMGQIYAASAMYGYFLRRVLSRFKLDESFQTVDIQNRFVNGHGSGSQARQNIYPIGVMKSVAEKGNLLATYVMSFHEDILKQNAKMRTREGVQVIERHAQALFGKPLSEEIGKPLTLSCWGVQRLVLEALAFGTFLWDVEECVELHYALSSEN